MATFIFDFDGTLADTFPLVADVTYGLTGGPRLDAEQIKSLERLPMLDAVRGLGVPRWKIPLLILLTRRRLTARISAEVPPYPGVVETVRQLHKAGHRLFILSSNYTRNVHVFLETHHVSNCFERVYHCSVFYKFLGMRWIMRRNRVEAANCYYVGNEAGDMRAAARAGIRGIAVTWSGQDTASLQATHPFKIVDEPHDLLEVSGVT